jgi:hypothetical protein
MEHEGSLPYTQEHASPRFRVTFRNKLASYDEE